MAYIDGLADASSGKVYADATHSRTPGYLDPYPTLRNIFGGFVHFDFNVEASVVHQANQKWWHDLETGKRLLRNKGELLMLVSSELAEALEGERKSLKDDKLTHRPMAEVEIADTVIRALDYAGGHDLRLTWVSPVKLTDNRAESLMRLNRIVAKIDMLVDPDLNGGEDDEWWITHTESLLVSRLIISCFAYCDKFEYDLVGAYHEKMAFNRTRADHSVEERKKANGKKF